MRAAVVEQYGGPDAIVVKEVADPTPGPDEIRVAVSYSACNRADTLQRQGAYPDPVKRAHEILGLEYAGVVESIGSRVTQWSVGDRVMGIEAGACNAELVITHERMAMPVPESVADAEMAGILHHGVGRARGPRRPHLWLLGSCSCGSEWGWHGRNSDREIDWSEDRSDVFRRQSRCMSRPWRRSRA
ncbi:MAG: alcohol dehydrogenase catalytic domain-containing protein [Ilumatobacteraceae bacterium]